MKQGEYFGDPMGSRMMLLWSQGVHERLDHWELLVAEHVARGIYQGLSPMAPAAIWRGEREHHLLLVAAAQLHQSWKKSRSRPNVWPDLWDQVVQVRNLLEHWDENMSVFQQEPRSGTPAHSTGIEFAETCPDAPYCWYRWHSTTGPMVTPMIPAEALRHAANTIERHVLDAHPLLHEYTVERSPSPWNGADAGEMQKWYPIAALWA